MLGSLGSLGHWDLGVPGILGSLGSWGPSDIWGSSDVGFPRMLGTFGIPHTLDSLEHWVSLDNWDIGVPWLLGVP